MDYLAPWWFDADSRFDLTWDRFLRLHNTAEAVKQRVEKTDSILDVGGFDGALAMFLVEYQVHLIDPITTGGTGHSIAANSYDVVVSIDNLEHVPPTERKSFSEQLILANQIAKLANNLPILQTFELRQAYFAMFMFDILSQLSAHLRHSAAQSFICLSSPKASQLSAQALHISAQMPHDLACLSELRDKKSTLSLQAAMQSLSVFICFASACLPPFFLQ